MGLVPPHRCVFDSLFPGVGLLPVGDKVKTVSQVVPRVGRDYPLGRHPLASAMGAAPPPHPTLGTQDPPELGLLEAVRACDLSVHLVQLPGKGGL